MSNRTSRVGKSEYCTNKPSLVLFLVCTHVHGRVDLGHGLVVDGKLVDLHAVAHQLAHDLDLELVQLALGDGVGFSDDGDDVDLRGGRSRATDQYRDTIAPSDICNILKHYRDQRQPPRSSAEETVRGACCGKTRPSVARVLLVGC